MRLRSLLFIPADSERKYARGRDTRADALILDLEDSVAPAQKSRGRDHVSSLLKASLTEGPAHWVRINPLDSGLALDDLAAVVRPGLAGIMLPKANGGQDILRLSHYLDALEAREGLTGGRTRIIPVATETPQAMFALDTYRRISPRLAALTWGAEDLGAAVGATTNRHDNDWTEPYRYVRSQCLFAAAAADVSPLETLYADFRDDHGLKADCARARRDGFTGRVAIHPDQIDTINDSFSPTADELTHARRIVEAFDANPTVGVVGLDGRMYDLPHLKAARRVLAASDLEA